MKANKRVDKNLLSFEIDSFSDNENNKVFVKNKKDLPKISNEIPKCNFLNNSLEKNSSHVDDLKGCKANAPIFSTSKISVKESALHRNGVFAQKDLKIGEHIFQEDPFVYVLNENNSQNLCWNCLRSPLSNDFISFSSQESVVESKPLSRCGKCKLAWYCSKECQHKDWFASHKIECPIIFKNPKLTPSSVRLIGRLLITPSKSLSFLDKLVSNRTSFLSKAFDEFGELSLLLKEYLPASHNLIAGHILDMWCKRRCNFFGICDDELIPVGEGLYEVGSYFNHSCTPNATYHFEGNKISFRAIKKIASNQEITISYIDLAEPFHLRKKKLSDYFFNCSCERCLCEQITENDLLSVVHCRKCQTSLRLDELTRSDSTCSNCEISHSKFFQEIKEEFAILKKLVHTQSKEYEPSVQVRSRILEKARNLFSKRQVPESHYFFMFLYHSLFVLNSQEIVNNIKVLNNVGLKHHCHQLQLYFDKFKQCSETIQIDFLPLLSVLYASLSQLFYHVWNTNIQKDSSNIYEILPNYEDTRSLINVLNSALSHISCTHGKQSNIFKTIEKYQLSCLSYSLKKMTS